MVQFYKLSIITDGKFFIYFGQSCNYKLISVISEEEKI
jgi:hypothetical protein